MSLFFPVQVLADYAEYDILSSFLKLLELCESLPTVHLPYFLQLASGVNNVFRFLRGAYYRETLAIGGR